MQLSLFIPGNSILHRFDPRAKLILLVFFVVYLFLSVPLACSGLLLFSLFLLTLFCLPRRDALKPILSIWPILLLIALLTPPFYPEQALLVTGTLLLRITVISYLFSLYFKTTENSLIILSLRWFALPYTAALTITIALRFIPFLGGVYHQVVQAHMLRGGVSAGRRRFSGRLKNLIPTLTSVMIYAIKSIPELSSSLEHRGFGSKERRMSYKSLDNGLKPFTHMAISGMIAVIFILIPQVCA